ncbi:MAG: hypothetical protein JSU87_10845 [Gemmatimonadota bacterium]|nr:MAG: hypothetical protein JSU87_10845 [Gemmatimonadota bacterium]
MSKVGTGRVKKLSRFPLVATVLCAVIATANPLGAQQEEQNEPLYDELVRTFKKKSLSIGALFQTVGVFEWERSLPGGNGFSIANMRLLLYGELDSGFGYFFQTNFARSPTVLDAKMYYKISPALIIDAGLFKAPFSREFLTPASSIDFVDRSRVATLLVPGRQLGVQARGEFAGGEFAYSAGAFNGNRFIEANINDNNDFLIVGRLSYLPRQFQGAGDADRLEVAVNAGFSKDADVVQVGFPNGFAGDRALVGGDVRFTRKNLLLAGEIIAVSLDADDGAEVDPYGWHLTAGYMVGRKAQALVRWDKFDADTGGSNPDQLVLGVNVWPTQPTEIQVNYVIPTSGGVDAQLLLLNFQVGF